MATKIKTIAPVDSISGMIGQRKDYVSKKAFICNVSKRGNVKSKGSYMYLSVRVNDRSTPVSATETANRAKFATCVANTRTAMMDPMLLPTLQVGYRAQKVYPTFYGYVFSLEWAKL